ncbi:MAG: CvpA family protein, partial [Eubacteriales bacterium]|nr:CvpA family protein [Eubacteriales bacterium]
MKEKGKVISTNILITLAVGLIYFYIELPAINLHDPEFYIFFLLLLGLYCLLSVSRLGFRNMSTFREVLDGVKQSCAIPALICAGLAVFYLGGTLISSPIIRARSYRDLLVVDDGDFAAEVDEISYDQIPMLDEDSAKKLGDRKLGELSDMVSQFEVADD